MAIVSEKFSEYMAALTEETAPGSDSLVLALVDGLPKSVSLQNATQLRNGRLTFAAPTSFCNGAAQQADGKILLIGQRLTGPGGINEFTVARVSANGDLDTSFGTAGFADIIFRSDTVAGEGVHAVVQADGKILAIGWLVTASDFYVAVARLNTDGSLDGTWAATGPTPGMYSSKWGTVNSGFTWFGQLDANGKLVICGNGNGTTDPSFIFRFNTDGSLDSTFGTGGKVTNAAVTSLRYLLIQSDGKILVAGVAAGGAILARYSALGVLDSGFGSSGTITETFASITAPAFNGILIQSTGKIVAGGSGTSGGFGHQVMARYAAANGAIDTTFGVSGRVDQLLGTAWYASPRLLGEDDSIIASGTLALTTDQSETAFAMSKHRADGVLDKSWGASGLVTINMNGQVNAGASAGPYEFGSKLFLPGQRQTGGIYRWAFYQSNKYGEPDPTFGDLL